MAAISESIANVRSSIGNRFNWEYFLQDNVTGSRWQTAWVILLTLATAGLLAGQLSSAPTWTVAILIIWAVFLGLAIANSLFGRRTRVGEWLATNLVSSVSNSLMTLFLMLVLAAAFRGFWSYAIVNATFDPALTAPDVRTKDGATWGWLASSENGGARDLLFYGRLDRQYVPRVQASAGLVLVLSLITFAATRTGIWDKNSIVRRVLLFLWVLSPFALFILLNGLAYEPGSSLINPTRLVTGIVVVGATYAFLYWQKVIKFSPVGLGITLIAWPVAYLVWRLLAQSQVFPAINIDTWGGLMLTLIIAASVILASFPIGILLALGRQSQVRGIPGWLTWPITIGLTVWGLTTSTPELLENSRNTIESILSFWPLVILAVGAVLQQGYKGNVVAAFSTFIIEVVRGVPLITILFMGIIMAPFFFQRGTVIPNSYAAILGYIFFASAYMAELIRGGLQAIPKGQYEAADALGLNTLQKMRFIIFPQALRILIPALVGNFIGNFKSSSLVSVVGLFDLVGIAAAIVGNPQWLGLKAELYYAMAVFYFIVSFAMSTYSRRLETRLGVGVR